MKRLFMTLPILMLSSLLFGVDFHETRTDHYLIKSSLSSELSAQTGYVFEQLYGLFQELTGEPYGEFPPLVVVELGNKEDFDKYLSSTWMTQSPSYLLIRQGDSGYSEIIIHRIDGAVNMNELAHLALFQYLEACNSKTPFWLKEGLARYFEMVVLQEGKNPVIPFNWGAYGEYKKRNEKIPLDRLLLMEEGEMIRESSQTYPECWGFTYFLMNAKEGGERILWDYLFQVRTGRTEEWPPINSQLLEEKYLAFMEEIDPYPAISVELKSLFSKDYYTKALELIRESGEEESWLGLYYKGLIHYERGLYEDSLEDFTKALERGGSEGIMKFAMGLSNLELGKREAGIKLLKEAREINNSLIPPSLNPLLE